MKQRLLYIIIGVAFVLNAFSQISYRTAELKRLASVMAIDMSALKEGYNLLSLNNRPLVVIVKNNAVSHIGWQLFSKDASRQYTCIGFSGALFPSAELSS